MLSKRAIVFIEWLDALSSSDNAWRPQSVLEAQQPCRVETVGFLMANEPTHYTVAGSLTEDGDAGNDITIPKGMVLQYEVLG